VNNYALDAGDSIPLTCVWHLFSYDHVQNGYEDHWHKFVYKARSWIRATGRETSSLTFIQSQRSRIRKTLPTCPIYALIASCLGSGLNLPFYTYVLYQLLLCI